LSNYFRKETELNRQNTLPKQRRTELYAHQKILSNYILQEKYGKLLISLFYINI